MSSSKDGDMVWGKFGKYPWWPGQIYNEAFACFSVMTRKENGCVLVAFFGDSTYVWMKPDELIPFEKNFGEKSREICSRKFLKAIDGAMVELSWRMSLGLACQCRDEFNFQRSTRAKDYVMANWEDDKQWPCSINQIKKARDSFRPKDMLSFIQEQALAPMNFQQKTIESVKNKVAALACRKAFYEKNDPTYAEAFASSEESPPVVNPSKALLSGQELVIPDARDKAKTSLKSTKIKEKLHAEIIAGKSMTNKRPIEELSHKNRVTVQNKRPEKGKGGEDVKNKAAVLACRKAFYEKNDNTYAEASASLAERPPRATTPSVVNPSKAIAPLSGRELAIPEACDKAKTSFKSTKIKEKLLADSSVGKPMVKKRPIAELRDKNRETVQNKRPKKGKSEEDVKTSTEPKELNPTKLIIKFPHNGKLPSIKALRATFTGFGPLEHSATKVFSRTFTCQLVYRYKDNAVAALKFAKRCRQLFGNSNISCHIIELVPDKSKSATKVVSVGASQSALGISQPPLPLKSCLKRSASRNDFPNTVLASSSAPAQPVQLHSLSYPSQRGASAPAQSVQFHSLSYPSQRGASASAQPVQFHSLSYPSQRGASANADNDISGDLMNLLIKCRDVIDMGYSPYQPL